MLLVEDNEDDIELTVRALKKNNLENELVIARNGKQALEIVLKPDGELPEVVLLDLNLAGMSGLDVLTRQLGLYWLVLNRRPGGSS